MKRLFIILFLLIAGALYAQDNSSSLVLKDTVLVRDDEGHLQLSIHYIYDDGNRLAAQIEYCYDDNGAIENRTIKYFNKQGQIIRTEVYTADEQLLLVRVDRYNRKGQHIKMTITEYSDDGTKRTDCIRYKYLPDGIHLYLNGKDMNEKPESPQKTLAS